LDETLAALAAEYWDAGMELSPMSATLLGDHRFDDRINDLSAAGEEATNSRMQGYLDRAECIDPSGLSKADRVTRGMLISELRNTLLSSEAFGSQLSSDQMRGIHSVLLRIFPQTTVTEPEHAEALLDRFAKMGGMIDQAADRFREGMAAGHVPARINVERSLSQLDAYLASPLDGDPIASVGGPSDWDGEARWRASIGDLIESGVRPAFDRYRSVLRDELLPAARPDDRPGLKWMADGPEAYDKYIEIFTSLDLGPQEIHEIGRHEVEEVLPAQYEEIGKRALGISTFADVLEALRTNQAMMYRDPEHMFALAEQTMDRALAVVPDWFGVTPEAPCRIQAVPAALAADVPAAYYFPPAPDGSRPGTYFVNTNNAENRNMFEGESVAFHEAIPGHHFQLALAAELEGLPMFQRYATATAFVEGWGLYTERLADEMGLYSSDIQRLGMLAADSWRGCRLVLDTGIHYLGWGRREAIDYMARHTPVRTDDIEVEVDRYIGMPGQALAYKVGQREIFRLRAVAQDRLGDRFDIREFHDTCLTSGSVTLPILAELVEDWITSKA